ncbi:unnamed protein product, partial [Ectocarpus fasciculatus]
VSAAAVVPGRWRGERTFSTGRRQEPRAEGDDDQPGRKRRAAKQPGGCWLRPSLPLLSPLPQPWPVQRLPSPQHLLLPLLLLLLRPPPPLPLTPQGAGWVPPLPPPPPPLPLPPLPPWLTLLPPLPPLPLPLPLGLARPATHAQQAIDRAERPP